MPNSWMIRSGRGAAYLDEFLNLSIVAVGWSDLKDISQDDLASLKQRLEQSYPHYRKGKIAASAGVLRRFRDAVAIGDSVVTYDPERRIYHLGKITGNYEYAPDRIEPLPNVRRVTWQSEAARDNLKQSTRNQLGGISTLFQISPEATADLLKPSPASNSTTAQTDDQDDTNNIVEDIGDRALELIKDTVRALDDRQMEELLAGILQAMGYKSQVAPVGPDRGIDVTASPDGLGLEQPRIKAEVKHRPNTQMGAPAIRNFISALRPGDSGIYLSTGGFSKEARYEADRSNIQRWSPNLGQPVKVDRPRDLKGPSDDQTT